MHNYLPTTNTTGRHLGFERDYHYPTAFRACYVIMHKVYCLTTICYPKVMNRVVYEQTLP